MGCQDRQKIDVFTSESIYFDNQIVLEIKTFFLCPDSKCIVYAYWFVKNVYESTMNVTIVSETTLP